MTVEGHELHIRSGRDIVEALYHSDPGVRLAVIQAIAEHPDQVLKYGPVNGRDLIEELIDLIARNPVTSEKAMYLGALASFDDPRVVGVMETELLAAADAEIVLLCARRLARESQERFRRLMAGLLLRTDRPIQARVAANMLAGLEGLPPRESLRAAILSDKSDQDPPVPDESTYTLWREVLDGPFSHRARRLAETLGPAAYRFFGGKWPELSAGEKEWLLDWGGRDHQEAAAPLVSAALAGEDQRLLLGALTATLDWPVEARRAVQWPPDLGRHENPEIRRAWALSCPATENWRELLVAEDEIGVRTALMTRLAETVGAAAVDDFFELLEDRDWRIRAAAAKNLTDLGGRAVIERARKLMDRDSREVRAAAAQILIGLGQEDWLEENVLL